MAEKRQEARKLVQAVEKLNTLEQDPRISKEEITAIDFINNANWDMLKGMRLGVHNKQEFTCLGVTIYLRLLCSGEKQEILNKLLQRGLIPGTTGIWEMEYVNETLCRASTKHPNLKDEPTLSLETLNAMPDFLIDELSRAYIDYVKTLHVPVDALSEEQVKEYIEILEKKPRLLSDLPYSHKEQIMTFTIKHYLTLLEQTSKLLTQS